MSRARRIGGIGADVSLALLTIAAVRALGEPLEGGVIEAVGERIDVPPLFLTLFLVGASSAALAARLCARLWRSGRALERTSSAVECGTVATEFVLVLPVLILLFGTMYQTALIANAAQVIRYAAFAGARSAIVQRVADLSLQPEADLGLQLESPGQLSVIDETSPRRAVAMVLASLSPLAADEGTGSVGRSYGEFVAGNGGVVRADVTANCYGYAEANTEIVFTVDETSVVPDDIHWVQPQYQLAASEGLFPTPSVQHVLSLAGIDLDELTGFIENLGPLSAVASGLFDGVMATFESILQGLLAGPIQAFSSVFSSVVNSAAGASDPLAPNEVTCTVRYMLHLPLPSLYWSIEGAQRSESLGGYVMQLKADDYFSVTLHMPPKRSNILSLIPKVPSASSIYQRARGEASEVEWVHNNPMLYQPRD